MATIQESLQALVNDVNAAFTQVATDIKAGNTARGSLSALTTSNKTSLVAAINEIAAASAAATGIDDGAASGTSTWSSQKVQQMLAALKTEILDGAPDAFDTLKEIAAYIESDKTGAAAMATAINNRVRFDEAQVLTAEQQTQACSNLGIGVPATTFLQTYNNAKA